MAKRASKSSDHWPASEVVLRPVSALSVDPENARQHPPQQIATLANLMLEYGFTVPVLVDEDLRLTAKLWRT